ncbi:hypothetical protein BAE44_0002746 [Dichanthelium oligosanthes]|uniref:Uncharacterized protein n=1 Tax=Dichanthelium oligosanthes TaxID=888268 RepID=A0A1E5WFR1_9POAL|nr:hypothetical protein BAE44_0002746 [Dichanthelium oligosanthes]
MLRALTGACGGRRGDAYRFQEIVEESFKALSTPNVSDIFPALRWVDRLRGVDAALARLQARRDALLASLINDQQRRKRDAAGGRDAENNKAGAIDELLSLQEIDPQYYIDTIIKGIIITILSAGTDTTVLTTEWAMALLLQHPEAMRKARTEIDTHVGTARLVEESDITNLQYLHVSSGVSAKAVPLTWQKVLGMPMAMATPLAAVCRPRGFVKSMLSAST